MKTKRIIFVILFILAVTAPLVLAQTSPSAGQGLLADRHVEERGLICEDCHGAGQSDPTTNPAKELCLDCHGDWDLLAELIEGRHSENPHFSHMGPGPCNECHQSHVKSVLICDQCHNFQIKVP